MSDAARRREGGKDGVARRTIVAGAWVAPVVATAVAAPSASASPAGFDLVLDPPQLGDSYIVYNGDFTHIYQVGAPIAWIVANHGSVPAPGGFPLTITLDNRLFRIDSVSGAWQATNDARTDLPIESRSVNGNTTTVTVTVPETIPPGTDSYSGYGVWLKTTFLAEYPRDGVDAPANEVWQLMPPAGDANAANNIRDLPASDEGPAQIWGAIVKPLSWQTRTLADGTSFRRPERGQLTSVGPAGIPTDQAIETTTPASTASAITIAGTTINGVPADVFGPPKATVDDYYDQLLVAFPIVGQVGGGDVVEFTLDYADITPPQQSAYGWTGGQTWVAKADGGQTGPEQRRTGQESFGH
ncbi:hypothetical protein [Flexivirga meconopsidis]|uniref:hypothetical protein n=1 Tax=Flexivirga meconopsidis TaxID=2977121 RepID=UPI00223FEACC|nr:hypothetical protein [Flexivirga meconopsidis]